MHTSIYLLKVAVLMAAIKETQNVLLNTRVISIETCISPVHTQMAALCLKMPHLKFNPLAPNDVYISRTTQLTSRRRILNIYSTNILTEYFKHASYSPLFFSLSLQDAVYFIMLSFMVPVIFTF